MQKNAGDNEGYQLRITYDALENRYSLSGFIIIQKFQNNDKLSFAKDGKELYFDSIEEVLEHITQYK